MESVKGIYKNVNLEQILDKLNNIQSNEYTEIKVELIKNSEEHYIFEENNELTIMLSRDNLSKNDIEICTKIAELIKEYNKDRNDKKIEEISNSSINEAVEEIVDKNSELDTEEYNRQLERVQRKIDECKQKGEYITTKIKDNDTYYGIDIDGTFIDINGKTFNIDKIVDSDEFKDIIRDIPEYNATVPLECDMQDEKVSEQQKGFKDSLKYNIDKKVEDNKPKVKKIKRTLTNGYKNVKNKVYKLSNKTKEKVDEVIEYLSKNGKKIASRIAVIALVVGIAGHAIDTTIEGYKTYDEYGSIQDIKVRMEDVLTEEFRKSLNNNNIELELDVIDLGEEEPLMLRVEIIDPNDPDYNKIFILNDMFDIKEPRYIKKVAQNYIRIDGFKKDDSKVSGTITGRLLNKTEKLAEKNDIIIKNNKFTKGENIDRVPERKIKTDIEER